MLASLFINIDVYDALRHFVVSVRQPNKTESVIAFETSDFHTLDDWLSDVKFACKLTRQSLLNHSCDKYDGMKRRIKPDTPAAM